MPDKAQPASPPCPECGAKETGDNGYCGSCVDRFQLAVALELLRELGEGECRWCGLDVHCSSCRLAAFLAQHP